MGVIAEAWKNLLFQISTMGIADVLDIAIVAVILYYIMKYIRERRAGKLAIGVFFLIVLLMIAVLLDLKALAFLMRNVFQVGVLALVVLFQPELRSVLEKMGGESLRSFRTKEYRVEDSVINHICQAATEMSKEKTGALIVIERTTKLGDIIRSGTVINADMSQYLLRNIFFNKAPMHDGAVIVRDGRIYAAGCFLPLSTDSDIIKDLGTRHRAAIGMSENSDAVIVVVSEETGTISVAFEGKLRRNFDYMMLRRELESLLNEDPPKIREQVKRVLRKIDKNDRNV